MPTIIDLRDEALAAAEAAHDRVRHELAIYRNEAYAGKGNKVGRVFSMAGESLDPKVRKGINRLLPGFQEQMARIEVQPDRSYRTEEDIVLCEDIQNWLDMNDEVADEGGDMTVAIMHNLALGNAICKTRWDARRMTVVSEPIHPLTFSVDPACTKSDLSNAEYVNHRQFQSGMYVKMNYPKFKLEKLKHPPQDLHSDSLVVDELWIRAETAKEYGVKVDEMHDGSVLQAVFIQDILHRVRVSPYWWPDFPFAAWRNFIDMDTESGLPCSFWGHGYGVQLWNNQKLLDEMLANLVLISRNQAVGRFLTKRGALDMEQVLPVHGLNIEVEEGFTLEDIQHLPPDAIPPVLFQIVEVLMQSMDEEIPSLADVFTGEAPYSGASGRAVNALQYASFSQLASNIRAMNRFRLRRGRMKVSFIQQYARRPSKAHLWRGGVDLPQQFPEDARHVGYQLVLPDVSSLPNTPAGRMQIVQMLASMGMMMSPEKMLEFIGLDKGFGLQAADFMPMQMGPGGMGGGPAQADEQVISGLEKAMKAER